jgi:hypothetical protein
MVACTGFSAGTECGSGGRHARQIPRPVTLDNLIISDNVHILSLPPLIVYILSNFIHKIYTSLELGSMHLSSKYEVSNHPLAPVYRGSVPFLQCLPYVVAGGRSGLKFRGNEFWRSIRTIPLEDGLLIACFCIASRHRENQWEMF